MRTPRPSLLEPTARSCLRWTIAGLLAMAIVASSRAASALPEFPGIVQETLGLTCPPPCLLCHTMPVPQPGDSADQKFADNVRAFTDMGVSEETLPTILRDMETNDCANPADPSCATMPCGKCNADGTGDPDIVEITNDQNPNNTSTLPCPRYGCGALVAPERRVRTVDGSVVALILAAAAFVRRSRPRLRRAARR